MTFGIKNDYDSDMISCQVVPAAQTGKDTVKIHDGNVQLLAFASLFGSPGSLAQLFGVICGDCEERGEGHESVL